MADDGWAGEDSFAPTSATMRNTRRVLSIFSTELSPPEITPNESGTITLEWESENGYCALEIGESKFSMILRSGSAPSQYANGVTESLPLDFASAIRRSLF
jgi:hypothetical protein